METIFKPLKLTGTVVDDDLEILAFSAACSLVFIAYQHPELPDDVIVYFIESVNLGKCVRIAAFNP